MTTAADIRADSRADARRRLRSVMLEAAREAAVAGGWGAVRMGSVATRVGVSRQTLHAEFGTKDALGQALILREIETFLAGVTQALEQQPDDLQAAIRAAVEFTLRSTARNPLLQTILTSTRSGGDETLLPLLTSRSEPLLQLSSDVLRAWLKERHQSLDDELVDDVIDSVVRLVVSHAVLPTAPPSVVAERIARLAARSLTPS